MRIHIKQGESFFVDESDLDNLKNICQKKAIVFSECYNSNLKLFSFPSTHVGYLKLSDKEVFINPRFPNFSLNDIFLLYLVNFDFSFSESLISSFASLLKSDVDVEYLSAIFVNEMKTLIRKGLPLKFNSIESRGNYLKGKINWVKSVSHINAHKKKPIHFTSNEISTNSLPNQLLLLALEKIKDGIDKQDYVTIRAVLPQLIKVDKDITNKVKVDRSNINASKCIDLAKIILLNLIPTRLSGRHYGEAFIINYDLLFQNFITKMLLSSKFGNKFLKPSERKSYAEFTDSDTNLVSKSYIPDILYREGTIVKGILDVKNKFPDIYSNPDVFQMLFYCIENRSKIGILIYPSETERNFNKLNFNLEKTTMIYSSFFNVKCLQEGNFKYEFERFTNEVNALLS